MKRVGIACIVCLGCALGAPSFALADEPAPPAPAPASEPAPDAPAEAPAPAPEAQPASEPIEVTATPVVRRAKLHKAAPLPQVPGVTWEQKRYSRAPEIATTVVAGGLLAATLVAFQRWEAAQDRRRDAQWESRTAEEHQANIDATVRWQHRWWALTAGTFVTGGVAAFLWTRHGKATHFSVQPADVGTGAAVSYGHPF